MASVFEPALSGRSKCRSCRRTIQRGEMRFGERVPNPFAEGETTVWFHPLCAAYKRPEPLLQALAEASGGLPDRQILKRAAASSLAQRRIPRIDGVDKATSAKAKCRSCRRPIVRGEWRVRLVFYEEGRFSPGGFVHFGCRKAYFETEDILDHALHFSPTLADEEREELRRACVTG